jgi:hypothetical protein
LEVVKSCNCKQKSSQRLWSSPDNCCTIWMRYGSNTKRLSRTLHTVVLNISSSFTAVPVDFFRLCRKLARTRSTLSSAGKKRPLDFCLQRHPVSVNCLYHAQVVLCVGRSFARNVRCTVTTDLLVWYSNTQNYFSPGVAIFSLHTLALPCGRNVNYDEKQLSGEKIFWVVPSICTSFVNTCPMVIINFCNPGVHYETPCMRDTSNTAPVHSLSSIHFTSMRPMT